MPAHRSGEKDGDLREYLSKLQGVFVLVQLMTESTNEDHILRLAGSAVPSLGPFRLLGIHFRESGWTNPADARPAEQAQAEVESQLPGLTASQGPVAVPGQGEAWAYAMRSLRGLVGHLVVLADSEPTPWAHFLLGTLAQQTGIALTNARLYSWEQAQAIELRTSNSALAATVAALERSTAIHDQLTRAAVASAGEKAAQAIELRASNSALAATVAALERSTAIHDQLTRVAVAGAGEKGIAEALHELTGWPVAIEDRHGNLRAWAGPGEPCPYPKESQAARDELIRRARTAGKPIYETDHLLTIASPRPDVVGVIVLMGVPPEEAERAHAALEHGSTVLAMELARLQAIAETELRLGHDLVEELLAHTNEQAALNRAQAMGYDLRRPHRVAVVVAEEQSGRHDPDIRFQAVRRAARDAAVGTLLVPRGEAVVVLAHSDRAWHEFHLHLRSELGQDAVVGVGSPCEELSDFPRSYREAMLALRMRSTGSRGRRTIFYEQLGTYRLLAEVGELGVVDRFVEEWIGPLIAYDSDHGAELVATLSTYLECRGNYDATAAALFVHRNTLKYRLRRIKEISNLDLKDADTLFNLQLATRALATRHALEHPDGESVLEGARSQPLDPIRPSRLSSA
ncbi:PucR family transcriptional regulator [Pseudonocardia sp. CA-142604]|uniref:PucR family transcriptional regulator n=1 Tax=Pseudonocardia sp. CA-142604 TaxID=3240024 RepID=UPI003D8DD275